MSVYKMREQSETEKSIADYITQLAQKAEPYLQKFEAFGEDPHRSLLRPITRAPRILSRLLPTAESGLDPSMYIHPVVGATKSQLAADILKPLFKEGKLPKQGLAEYDRMLKYIAQMPKEHLANLDRIIYRDYPGFGGYYGPRGHYKFSTKPGEAGELTEIGLATTNLRPMTTTQPLWEFKQRLRPPQPRDIDPGKLMRYLLNPMPTASTLHHEGGHLAQDIALGKLGVPHTTELYSRLGAHLEALADWHASQMAFRTGTPFVPASQRMSLIYPQDMDIPWSLGHPHTIADVRRFLFRLPKEQVEDPNKFILQYLRPMVKNY